MADNEAHIEDPDYVPENGESGTWLSQIEEAQRIFKYWQDISDSIDKAYANLGRLASIDRSREFALFWSTMEVINPSIYSRPPVPVVVPRFKDRRPLYSVTSEFLERSLVTAIGQEDIDAVMKALRDDLGIVGRGAAWVDYYDKRGEKKKREYVCPVHVDRKDFLHEPARKWSEVGWVARREWLTHDQMQSRFLDKHAEGSEKRIAMEAACFKVMTALRNLGGATAQSKCPVWEVWSKTEDKVVWVTEGVLITLDEDKPHLELEGFFPCPKPAYATVQRQTLIPVPDMLQYKDQLEEVNQLTNRIHALSEAIKIKGFYPAGSEVGDAMEAAVAVLNDRAIMVPIKDWNGLTTGTGGQPVFYWPVEIIAAVVQGLVTLRNEVINNVYQIVGISDIMRGSTESSETLGAQELKAQFGSVRIRDKQQELVRIARDLIVIMAEIMAEEFDKQTLLDMSQMEIPTDAEIAKQVKPLEAQAKDIPKQAEKAAKEVMKQAEDQVKQAQSNPEIMQQAEQNPDQAKQALQQGMQQAQEQVQEIASQAQEQVNGLLEQIEKLQSRPTVEKVMKFLRDNKLRPFVLDIETDSTIQADEQAEKQARTEFVTALGGLVAQFVPLLQSVPAAAPMVGGVIKFALAPFRVGRELEGQIDETVEALTQQQGQQGPSPEQQAAEAEIAAKQKDMELKAASMQADDKRKAEYDAQQLQISQQKAQGELQIKGAQADYDAKLKTEAHQKQMLDMAAAEARADAAHQRDMENKALDIEAKQVSIQASRQQALINERAGEQKMALTAEQVAAKNAMSGGKDAG